MRCKWYPRLGPPQLTVMWPQPSQVDEPACLKLRHFNKHHQASLRCLGYIPAVSLLSTTVSAYQMQLLHGALHCHHSALTTLRSFCPPPQSRAAHLGHRRDRRTACQAIVRGYSLKEDCMCKATALARHSAAHVS